MAEVLFIYEEQKIIIQCHNLEDKMKDIINEFENKIKKEESNNLYYTNNGDKINNKLKLNQMIKDKNDKKINIFVIKIKEKEIISNEIICSECKENILININNHKINLYECKNGHKKENILLNEFENILKIDISKNVCNKCYKNNNNINEELYICNECNINLCPLCKYKHDKNHNIINYNDKNYICKKHNDRFIKYCKECKKIYVLIV